MVSQIESSSYVRRRHGFASPRSVSLRLVKNAYNFTGSFGISSIFIPCSVSNEVIAAYKDERLPRP